MQTQALFKITNELKAENQGVTRQVTTETIKKKLILAVFSFRVSCVFGPSKLAVNHCMKNFKANAIKYLLSLNSGI